MKELAKKWAEDFWKSEQGKAYIEETNKNFKDYILLDKPTILLNDDLLNEIKNYCDIENCPCCSGTGIVEGEYIEDAESCLTCNGRGFL